MGAAETDYGAGASAPPVHIPDRSASLHALSIAWASPRYGAVGPNAPSVRDGAATSPVLDDFEDGGLSPLDGRDDRHDEALWPITGVIVALALSLGGWAALVALAVSR